MPLFFENYTIINTMILFFAVSLLMTICFYADFKGKNFYVDDEKTLSKFEKVLSTVPFVINCIIIALFIIFYVLGIIFQNGLITLIIFLPAYFLGVFSSSFCPPLLILAIIFSTKHYKHSKNAKSKKYIILASISLLFSLLFFICLFSLELS